MRSSRRLQIDSEAGSLPLCIAQPKTITYECSDFGIPKLIGILYVHSISDFRLVRPSARSLHLLQGLCGEGALNKVILLTTMWKDVNRSTGEQRESELRGRCWALMIKLGSRVARFDDTRESAWGVLESLLAGGARRLSLGSSEEFRLGRAISDIGVGDINRDRKRAVPSWASKLVRLFFRRKKQKKTSPENEVSLGHF